MVKETLPKCCYLNLSGDDDNETLNLLDQINFKNNVRVMRLTMSMAARLTRIAHIVIHVHVVMTILMTMMLTLMMTVEMIMC